MKKDKSIKTLTRTAVMAALIFVSIFLIKIPVPNGYAHLGDCMIFLGVILLGKKQGALAGGIGAALSDLLAGYMYWVFPTFFIKYIMAFLMGLFMEKIHWKWNWITGAVFGGILQCLLYFIADSLFFGLAYGLADIPVNVTQTTVGLLLFGVLFMLLKKSTILKKIQDA